MTKPLLLAAFSALALGLLLPTPNAQAQSGTRVGKQAHYDVRWSWLQQSNYKRWNGADGQAPDFQKGESPHGALIKTYVSCDGTGGWRSDAGPAADGCRGDVSLMVAVLHGFSCAIGLTTGARLM